MEKNISGFDAGIFNTIPATKYDVIDIANIIKYDENLKKITTDLRLKETKEDRDKIKRLELIFVTWGGLFFKRTDNGLIALSGCICVDVDNLSEQEIERIRFRLIKSRRVIMLFVSPSGNGLKIVLRLTPSKSYKENYEAYTNWLVQEYNIEKGLIDSSCASVSKACFLCHDSDVYVHPHIKQNMGIENIDFIEDHYFKKNDPKSSGTDNTIDSNVTDDPLNLFESPSFQYYPIRFNFDKPNLIDNFILLCRLNIRDNGEFKVGNRHNWIFHLAVLVNKFGVKKEVFIKHFHSLFDNHSAVLDKQNKFNEKDDLFHPVESVYTKYKSDFNSWDKNDNEWETPVLPEEVFQKLPVFLKRLTNLFDSHRERDVFFLSVLTFLSTCFPRIKGVYDNRTYSMNLFLFVSAPAASGKGVLAWIRKIGQSIHSDFLDRCVDETKNYNDAEEEARKDLPKPVLKKLFIPANNTSARMISSIHANEGKFGIIMDTEADVLTNSNKSEHGAFSELLRKAFQNEAIDYERKGNNEYLSISEPAISILISGTPNQVKYLMRDLENGLTSRFTYYSYSTKAVWKDVFEEKTDFSYIFNSVGIELSQLVQPYFQNYLFDSLDIIRFKFSAKHQLNFNNWFAEKLKSMEHIYGNQIRGSVLRMGLIFFRISMVLTAIRCITSEKEIKETLVCSDDDFEIANSIISTLLHHTAHVFNQLKSNSRYKNHRQAKELYFEKLPGEFQRQQAIDTADLMQIKEKTAENYLSSWVESGQLVKIKHNHYKKAQP